ncbi:MAG: OB-fold putative lipoprotein [Bacteroidales bacterium]|nr:OB-fold putative lipoprotein [Bacteroidales bacterium]
MKRKKVLRIIAILGVAGLLIGGGIGIYMFNMPQRDVQSTKTDYSFSSSQLVKEYLNDKDAADQKYLASDGDSKILEVTGVVNKITEDFNGQKVVFLKDKQDLAGVSASFTSETESTLQGITVGEPVTIKGVIRSGAAYDEDLGFYLNVVLEKSAVI